MSWYHIPGNQQDVAVSTRVRLARNLAGYSFPARLDASGARAIIEAVGSVLEKNGFVHCGTIYLTDGEMRVAYEKQLEER